MSLTLQELQDLRDEQWRSLGVVREQFGDRSVEYSDRLKSITAIDREMARVSRGTTTGGSMCNLAQYGGYRGLNDI